MGTASTGWFEAGSSPTVNTCCETELVRSGNTVTVYWTVRMKLSSSSSYLGTGEIGLDCSCSGGGSDSGIIKDSSDRWSGTDEHSYSSSYTFSNSSTTTQTFTIYFSSWGDYSTSGMFDTSVDCSVNGASADKTIFVGINSGAYMEFMSKTQYCFPTWSDANGQDDIAWVQQGSGSWTRGGVTYPYAAGHTHSGGSLDDHWHTHIYSPDTSVGYGQIHYYPRLYIKYNANGGSSTPSTQTKYLGSTIKLASAISRTYYTFKGWSTSSTATSASWSAGHTLAEEAWNSIDSAYPTNNGWTTYTPTHSGNTVTLYAVWGGNTYTVSYNKNGGSSTPTSQSTTYPNSVTLASAISRSNGTSTSNVTITISYNVNGGNSTAPTASTGTAVNTTTTKYTFEKWHAGSTSGTAYSAGASYKPTANVTMYAGWTSSSSTTRTSNPKITLTSTKPTKSSTTVSSYEVSYDANSGSSTPASQTATKTRSYTFSKWNNKSDGTGTDYSSSTAYTFSASQTLYAKYTSSDSGGTIKLANAISRANGSAAGYSVTYNANGGSGAPSSQTSGNRTVTYTFDKWAAGSTSGTKYSAGANFTPSAATKMYATWTSSTSANSSWTCSSTKPTKTNYTFKGWSTSDTATSATYTAGTNYTITGALALYAVYSLNAPSDVTHTAVRSRDKIKVTASYTGAEISDITVYYRANSTGTYSSKSLGTSKTGEITGLTPNTNYQIYVTVTNAAGDASSTAAIVKTGAYLPTNPAVSVSNIQPFSVTAAVSATAETGAANSNYKVYYTKKISTNTGNMALMSLSDGSLWARCFYHNCQEGSNLFTTLAEIKSTNTATKFSVLGSLSNYKFSDGKYEFLIRYPNCSATLYNRWKQTNNPMEEYVTPTSTGDGKAAGYTAVHIDSTSNYWGGLTRQNSDASVISSCYLSGSVGHGNWYYAIGATSSHNYGMPASATFGADTGGSTWGSVELYVRIPDATVTTVDCGTSTSKSITGLEEETEYTMWMSATNAGGTNYSKAISFTTPADQARIRQKINGAWLKGKGYYKQNGSWLKIKKIYKKVNGVWKLGIND